MAATIYYDKDADMKALGDKTVAILGYGSQGHAHAQNLRESGVNVIVGQRPGSANYELAVSHGFEPLPLDEATKKADVVNILLPDEVQADIYRNHIRDHLSPGNVLMCSHGFNVHFGQVEPPQGVELLLVPCRSYCRRRSGSDSVAYASWICCIRSSASSPEFRSGWYSRARRR